MNRLRLLLGVILALAMPAAALAASADTTNVTLAKGDNRTGSYYAAGQTLTVDGDVTGDVICAGQTVVINGSVGGDVICGAQTLTVNGPVAGSVRGGAQVATINGTVGRNITVAAQNFVLGSAAKVGGEVAIAAETVTLNAPIGQAIYAAAKTLSLNSTAGGSVTAYAEALPLGAAAVINGNLDYTSDQTFTLDKSKVHGEVVRHAPAQPSRAADPAAEAITVLVYWIAAGLLGILLAVWLAPRLVRSVTNAMMTRWQASLGWGAVAVVAGPLVFVLLALTVVGLPTVAVVGTLWLMALMTSGLFAGVAVGRLAWQREDSNRRGLALAALVGVPLVLLAGWIPVLGALVGIGAAIWTLGGMVVALNRARSLG